jgi:hypothetical protein
MVALALPEAESSRVVNLDTREDSFNLGIPPEFLLNGLDYLAAQPPLPKGLANHQEGDKGMSGVTGKAMRDHIDNPNQRPCRIMNATEADALLLGLFQVGELHRH